MDKFLGQVVHEAAKIGRAVFLNPFQGHTMVKPEAEVPAEPEAVVPTEPEVEAEDELAVALEAVAKATLDAVLDAMGAVSETQKWANDPLSDVELNRAKILLAQKLDTQWEDR